MGKLFSGFSDKLSFNPRFLVKMQKYAFLKKMVLIEALYQRTSDSLNEGLPIKITREKFQRKWYFFYEKDSRFNPRLIHKGVFLIGQVLIKKYGLKTLFLLFKTYKLEKVLPPPRDQTNPFAYSCVFKFHTSYKNGMIGHGGGGRCQNAQKHFMIKTY